MGTLMQDVRYAWRQLRRSPGFAITALLTLALGIGVTVTVMALVYQVLLAPLPYPQANRIVAVEFQRPVGGPNDSTTGVAGDFVRQHAHSFAAAAFVGDVHHANFFRKGGRALSIPVMGVSREYFDVLGVQPVMGRGFTADEDRPGGPRAVVLSYGFWTSGLRGNRAIVGQSIDLDGEPVTVVGIMPKSFHTQGETIAEQQASPVAWSTLQAGPKDPGYEYNNYSMLARLRPGVTIEQAQAELTALQQQLYRADPYYAIQSTVTGPRRVYRLWPYAEVVASGIRPSLVVMGWAAAAVLLLTCLNLAGLNLARALQRAPEFALRVALGAARPRLLLLALLEVGMVALAGSVGALLVARALLAFLLHASPVPVPQLSAGAGEWALAGAALALGVGCAVLFGAPFALAATWRGGTGSMGQRTSGLSRSQVRTGRAIVAGQMALSLVLLSAAGVLLGTFLKLKAEPLGFNPQKLVVFETSLKGDRYATTQATSSFVNQVVAKLRATPGVSSAAASVGLPLKRGLNDDGWVDGQKGQDRLVQVRTVTPGFLQVMGLNLLAGHTFTASDAKGGQRVAVISAEAARRFWPGKPAVGETLDVDAKANTYRIIGVVANTPANRLGQAPDLIVYTPMAQQADKTTAVVNGWFPVSFVLKEEAKQNSAAIARDAVASVDPSIAVTGVTTMQAVVNDSVAAPRFFTEIAEGFAGFALLLTAIGTFGLLSYQAAQRTREIGVRMALGATRGRILRGVLRASALLCVAGGAAGLVVAALLQPVLLRWVGQVAAINPAETQYLPGGVWTIGIALAVLCVTALAAAVLPARRASRVEPMDALRTE